MDTSSSYETPPDDSFQMKDGRTPRVVHPSIHSNRGSQRLKKSTYYGILLYLQDSWRMNLSENQIAWIIYYSRNLDENQILRAVKIYRQLCFNDEFYSRLSPEIERIRYRIPRLEPKRLPEVRRIGTGYHDKGSLRPHHLKRNLGDEVVWDEDISYLLPSTYQIKGTWISAEEVLELTGVNLFQLMMNQLKVQTAPFNLGISEVELPDDHED